MANGSSAESAAGVSGWLESLLVLLLWVLSRFVHETFFNHICDVTHRQVALTDRRARITHVLTHRHVVLFLLRRARLLPFMAATPEDLNLGSQNVRRSLSLRWKPLAVVGG